MDGDDEDFMDCAEDEAEEELSQRRVRRDTSWIAGARDSKTGKASGMLRSRKEKNLARLQDRKELRDARKWDMLRIDTPGGPYDWINLTKNENDDAVLESKAVEIRRIFPELLQKQLNGDLMACKALWRLSYTQSDVLKQLLRDAWINLNLLNHFKNKALWNWDNHLLVVSTGGIIANLCGDKFIAQSVFKDGGLIPFFQHMVCGKRTEQTLQTLGMMCMHEVIFALEDDDDVGFLSNVMEVVFYDILLTRTCIPSETVSMESHLTFVVAAFQLVLLCCECASEQQVEEWFRPEMIPDIVMYCIDIYGKIPIGIRHFPLQLLRRCSQFHDRVNPILTRNRRFIPFVLIQCQNRENYLCAHSAFLILENYIYEGVEYLCDLVENHDLFRTALHRGVIDYFTNNSQLVGWQIQSVLSCMLTVAIKSDTRNIFQYLVSHVDIFSMLMPLLSDVQQVNAFPERVLYVMQALKRAIKYDKEWARQHFVGRLRGKDVLDQLYNHPNTDIHAQSMVILSQLETDDDLTNMQLAPRPGPNGFFSFGI